MDRKPYEPYLTVAQASQVSGIPVQVIRRKVRERQIPAYGSRRKFRIQLSDLLPVVDPDEPFVCKSNLRLGSQLRGGENRPAGDHPEAQDAA